MRVVEGMLGGGGTKERTVGATNPAEDHPDKAEASREGKSEGCGRRPGRRALFRGVSEP